MSDLGQPYLESLRAKSGWRDLIEGQIQHVAIVTFMGVGAWSLIVQTETGPWYLLLKSAPWAWLAIFLAVLHQVIVALVFRLQLYKNWMTAFFGERDMAVWAGIFMPLLIARPVGVLLVGLSDTTPITGARLPEVLLGLGLVGLAAYGMYSVVVYFTLPRALGGDHFRDEYAKAPLVKEGLFKYTSNGMYGVVFLGLSGISLICGSWNALVVALFQHAYIWVHMYCTEGPDMRQIYTEKTPSENQAAP